MQYLGSPELEFPAIHITGTNGKTTTVRVLTELLTALGLKVGAYTSPHLERVNERMSIDGRADRRRHVRGDAVRGLAGRGIGRCRPVVLRHRHLGRVPLVRGRGRRRRRGRGRYGRHVGRDQRRRRPGRGRHERERRSRRVPRARRASRSRRRRPASSSRARPSCSARPTPSIQAIFEARGRRRACSGATSTSVSRATCSRSAVVSSISAARARSIPTCSCRCTARTRPTTPRSRSAAAESFVAAPLPFDVVADAFARVQSPGRLEVVGRQPLVLLDGVKNVAGAQALRRALDEEFSEGSRTFVVGMLREKEPHEMLEALGVDGRRRPVGVLPPAEPAGARAGADREGCGRSRSTRGADRGRRPGRGRDQRRAARRRPPTARS